MWYNANVMEILMLLAIWVCGYGLVLTVIKRRVDEDTKRYFVRTACEHHKWVYKDDANGGSYMVCEVCEKLPGSDMDVPGTRL